MKLILVRHGETHWNKDGLVQGGDSDIELNDTGLEQARKTAAFLKNEPIVAILSSPLQRAIATAEVIASQHHLPVEIDQGLRELKVGDLEGMSISNLRTTFSRFLLQWRQDGEATKLPNGESLIDLQQRAWKVIEGLLEKHNDGTAVVVSHYFVTLTIILKALNLPLDCLTKFRLDLGGVSILEFRDYGARLVTFNDTSY
ncbi:MAG TPA: histidine phosphatase family protein [Dehalococcoidia bacterium]|nr:histidine phosphatase family protein [Dehalococcoidia bacterium]